MTESGYYGADVNAAVEMYTGEVARLNAEVARMEAENESLRGDLADALADLREAHDRDE